VWTLVQDKVFQRLPVRRRGSPLPLLSSYYSVSCPSYSCVPFYKHYSWTAAFTHTMTDLNLTPSLWPRA